MATVVTAAVAAPAVADGAVAPVAAAGEAAGAAGGGPGGGGFGGGRGGRSAKSHPAKFDAKPLTDLADDTGGTAQIVKGFDHYTPGSDEAPGTPQLKAAVESIASILRHRYLIGYEPPVAAAKHEWRTLRVEVDRSESTARTRKGYYAGE